MGLSRFLLASPLLLSLLAACAGGPAIDLAAGSNPIEARDRLRQQSAVGPVLVERNDTLDLSDEQVLDAVERGVSELGAEFTTDPEAAHEPEQRIVLAGGANVAGLCDDEAELLDREEAFRSLAYCEGDVPLAVAQIAPTLEAEEVERAIWRAMRRVFPDDYTRRRGLFGPYVGVGATIGSGGNVGLGGGVGIGF